MPTEMEERWGKRYELLKLALIAFIAVTVLVCLIRLLIIGDETQANTKYSKQNTQLLVDCTTPNHSCYEKGRSQTRDAIDYLRKTTIYANYCSQLAPLNTVEKQQQCVLDLLAKEGK